ncbi:MAG: pseudouridine synthase [Pseudohongiella nitratireducens]|nr:pseudouridine synthase [Pseudohongiella nitratireducens]MDF1622542.1 pseudouridine synthase [Pseudohongiella nitratireducens]
MTYKSTRLDRFVSQNSSYKLSDIQLLLAQKRIRVDGQAADSIQQKVSKFTHVMLDDHCLQNNQPLYIMLNKPKGVVSATKDPEHTTVLDLIDQPLKHELHIAGRLDFNSTGLVLLTNDGAWSREISLPATKLSKTYEVTLSKPVTGEYVKAFQQGIYFAYEDITTQPAQLEILSPYKARISLVEGKYHQVKRMFGYFQNEVLSLHRISVGDITLDGLAVGEWRVLDGSE